MNDRLKKKSLQDVMRRDYALGSVEKPKRARKPTATYSTNSNSGKTPSYTENFLNPAVRDRVEVVRLDSWFSGRTVFRIWNMFNPEDPSRLLPGRLSDGKEGLSGMTLTNPIVVADWFGLSKKQASDIKYGGIPESQFEPSCQFSYIITKDRRAQGMVDNIPYEEEPYVKLYKTIDPDNRRRQADGFHTKWKRLGKGGSKFQALTDPKDIQFVVCSLYENNRSFNLDKEVVWHNREGVPRHGIPKGEAPDDPLVLLMLSLPTSRALLRFCHAPDPDCLNSEDLNAPYLLKDPCGVVNPDGTVTGGVFFQLSKDHSIRFRDIDFLPPIDSDSNKSYDIAALLKYKQRSADLNAEQVQNMLNKHLYFWSDNQPDENPESFILHEPSIEERCEMIAQAFRPIPQLLKDGWMSNPEYLNFDSVKAIVNNRVYLYANRVGHDYALIVPDELREQAEAEGASPEEQMTEELKNTEIADEFSENFEFDSSESELSEDELPEDNSPEGDGEQMEEKLGDSEEFTAADEDLVRSFSQANALARSARDQRKDN
jgi:hypothetical protein